MSTIPIRFGTSGWRAILGDDFTLENVRLVTAGISRWVCRQKAAPRGLIVGHDTRFMGEVFAQAVVEVLAANGVLSYLCRGPVPTPVVAFEILRRRTAGGINLTASHNPAEYNGIKFSPAWAGPALPETTRQIERLINSITKKSPLSWQPLAQAEREGLVLRIDPREIYLEALAEKIDASLLREKRPRLVIDHMHGASSGYLDLSLERAGCKLLRLNARLDPYFGGARPDPAEENLQGMISVMKRDSSFQLGLATDGDADRFGVVDEGGLYMEANAVAALLLDHLIRTRGLKGSVARSVATTHLVDRVAQRHGLKVVETPVGFKYIGQLLASAKIVAGCEESAGFGLMGHVPEKDGILSCLLIAEMVAREGKSLLKLRQRLFRQVGPLFTRRQDIAVGKQEKKRLEKKLASPPDTLGGKKVVGMTRLDGTKLLLADDCWVLLRQSGTEPLVRLYVEAPTVRDLNILIEEGCKFILD